VAVSCWAERGCWPLSHVPMGCLRTAQDHLYLLSRSPSGSSRSMANVFDTVRQASRSSTAGHYAAAIVGPAKCHQHPQPCETPDPRTRPTRPDGFSARAGLGHEVCSASSSGPGPGQAAARKQREHNDDSVAELAADGSRRRTGRSRPGGCCRLRRRPETLGRRGYPVRGRLAGRRCLVRRRVPADTPVGRAGVRGRTRILGSRPGARRQC
jgi:hypothetical protein